MRSDNRKFVPEIDEIRALAALLVILYHGFQLVGAFLSHGGHFDPGRDWVFSVNPLVAMIAEGHTAVGLFIVLSGYILSRGAIGNTIHYGHFIAARALRIYPVYILLLAAALLTGGGGIALFFSSVLPLPAAMNGIVASPFSSMFWAVLVEFQCYLVFPFIIRFSNASGTRYLLGLVLAMIAIRVLAVFGAEANARDLSYWTVLGRLDQFVIGIALARLTLDRQDDERLRRNLFPVAIVLVLGLIVLFNRAGGWPSAAWWKILWPDIEALMWAFFIWCYIPASASVATGLKRLLQLFGLISYPVYLVHIVVITLVIARGLTITVTGNPHYDALITTAIVVLPIAAIVGTLLHVFVEKPFLSLRPRYIRRDETG